MAVLTPPTRLAEIPDGQAVLFRGDGEKSYALLRKVCDDGECAMMTGASGELSRVPADMTCYRVFLVGQKYTLAIPQGEALRRWGFRI